MKNLQHKEHKHKLKMLTPIHQQNHFQSLQSIVMGDSLLEKKIKIKLFLGIKPYLFICRTIYKWIYNLSSRNKIIGAKPY